jgi:hypothetical protein
MVVDATVLIGYDVLGDSFCEGGRMAFDPLRWAVGLALTRTATRLLRRGPGEESNGQERVH